jgi:CRP/FNR family transcriptional regulator, cyclic AMP receptor protein
MAAIDDGPLPPDADVKGKTAAKRPIHSRAIPADANGGASTSVYKKRQIMYSQGDAADSIFYVEIGKIKLSVLSEQGKEAVVGILGAGDFFGEGCLAGQARRMATAAAMMECTIMRIEKGAMTRLLRDEPALSERFMAYLLIRNTRIEEDLVDQLFNSIERRLARVLLILANFGKDGSPEPIVGKVTQEMLAEMIGATRARVSFFMNKFRRLGLIDYNGNLEVHSSLLDSVLHDDPHIKATRSSAPSRLGGRKR